MRQLLTTASALLFALASFSAQAQMADHLTEHPSPRQYQLVSAESMTREMANRLHLNEGQFLKLLPLNRTKLMSLNRISRECKSDEATRNVKLAELEAQYGQECSRILTPSQLGQLQQTKNPPPTEPIGTGNGLG